MCFTKEAAPHAVGTCPECGAAGWHPVEANEPSGLELVCRECSEIFYRQELVGPEIHGRIVNMTPEAAAEWSAEQSRMFRRAAMPRALRALADITQQRRVVAAELARIDTVRDDAIIAAIEAGHGAPTIAVHAGLTAARVYQIRDGKRRAVERHVP